jgi:protein-S-isoprenylcysteine O-methyltransferase Ste14
MLAIQITIFFIAAGRINIVRPWFFFVSTFLHYSISIGIQYIFKPEILVERLKLKRVGSKLWDEILMRVSNLVVLILVPAVSGLDIGRFHLSLLALNYIVIGLALLIISSVLLNWAMLENPYFEPTVRIQRDRDHKVIESGPYRFVRHPGYLAAILFIFSIPFLIGSLFSFIPAGVYTVLMVTRTLIEDKTLQRELKGYSEYANIVKYRLIPWIW